MLRIDVSTLDSFDDSGGTSDVVLRRGCPQKVFQISQGNWDSFLRQREFLLQIILFVRVGASADRNEWFSESREALRQAPAFTLDARSILVVGALVFEDLTPPSAL